MSLLQRAHQQKVLEDLTDNQPILKNQARAGRRNLVAAIDVDRNGIATRDAKFLDAGRREIVRRDQVEQETKDGRVGGDMNVPLSVRFQVIRPAAQRDALHFLEI